MRAKLIFLSSLLLTSSCRFGKVERQEGCQKKAVIEWKPADNAYCIPFITGVCEGDQRGFTQLSECLNEISAIAPFYYQLISLSDSFGYRDCSEDRIVEGNSCDPSIDISICRIDVASDEWLLCMPNLRED